MDASAETPIEGSDDKAEDHHVIQDGDPDLDLDLELDFAKMGVTGKIVSLLSFVDLKHRAQAVQTDSMTAESSVSTEPDWESHVAAVFQYTSTLMEQYDKLLKKQDQEEVEHEKYKQQLQKRKEEATRQHQVRHHKHTAMLAKELEEGEKKLTALTEEQSEEQRRWQEELEELRQEMEGVRKEAQEAQLRALQDEIAAVEKQRDVAMALLDKQILICQPPSLYKGPVRVTPPPSLSPSPPFQATHPVAPSPPPHAVATTAASSAPAGKLDKVLEKLGARFPQCNRVQLTSLLQQVKSSRGTLAGMSMEEVIEQVGFRLAQNERSALGPISRPTAPGPIQRPMNPIHRAAPSGHAAGPRKLCLMCQNHVDPESRHPLSCSHTIHKDCIQVWLQSSKNNSCPFCPAK
uniref:RING-type domain-containing protein n=1 Tax=Neolamprologus brichardi TaxID=32507 RepID=A0A3Q4H8I7_NEOBR